MLGGLIVDEHIECELCKYWDEDTHWCRLKNEGTLRYESCESCKARKEPTMYGTITHKNHTLTACCARPDFADGYIMHRIFPAVLCKSCGEITATMHPILRWVFALFVYPFWRGGMWVEGDQITEEELEKIERMNT
jgi:hypothetical protein